jgi:hypothetical protein
VISARSIQVSIVLPVVSTQMKLGISVAAAPP